MRLGIITGFKAEAKILARLSPYVACAGGRSDRAYDLASQFVADGCDALISCGIAGGLDDALPSGSVVLGRKVCSSQGLLASSEALTDRFAAALPLAHLGNVVASDSMIDTVQAKQSLHKTYHALTVDMESWGVARAALDCAVPFTVLRIVADPALRTLPPAALVGMDDQGQVPGLIRVALDTNTALSALARVVGQVSLAL